MAEEWSWTAIEALGVAIRSEIEAALLYERLSQQVSNPSLVAKLGFLRLEEQKHRAMLESLYAQRFPGVELKLPSESLVPISSKVDLEQMSVPDLLRLAMHAEEVSAAFYREQAERSRDETSRAVLRYLGNVEQGHLGMLETEYELLLRFPDYYNADDLQFGNELMHIGP